ncbi:DUF2797 domain-containing protein [Haloplanus halobius]|uniref:DUF2797 domain-containing protein n=1 Tax=Haloplanus halobius TaxID=2934938 RepID=UPI00200DCD1C
MQLVGYDATDGGLLVSDTAADADGGTVEYVALNPGERIEYRLDDRHCAGVVTDDGHRPCAAADAPHCPAHTSTWVCARCTGTCLKDEMDCFDDHAVYLAAFAPATFKVGVTKAWRLETRLREQGADRAAHVRTVENGRIAREIESELAERIPDRVRVPAKIAGLGRAVDDAAWDALLDEFDPIERFDLGYGLDLADRPVAETIATGTVRGTKGRLLVLDHGGSTYAVDLRDLVGYEVTEGGTDRHLQSSLGAFD